MTGDPVAKDDDKLVRDLRNAVIFRRRGRVCKTTGPIVRAAGNFNIGEMGYSA